jgi:hypothetical protein
MFGNTRLANISFISLLRASKQLIEGALLMIGFLKNRPSAKTFNRTLIQRASFAPLQQILNFCLYVMNLAVTRQPSV